MKKQNLETSLRKQRGRSKEDVVFPLPETMLTLPEDYPAFIQEIKDKVLQGRIKTVMSANAAMVLLYWEIGSLILQRQQSAGWGTKVIDRMSSDLKQDFPNMQGFSPRNLKYMRKFAEAYPDFEIVQRTVALIPWRSNITLLDKLSDPALRLWYAQKTLQYGFGKDMLVFQIETQLHKRQGASAADFKQTMPPNDSDLTAQIFKDPHLFDYLGTADPRRDTELKEQLTDQIQNFLLKFGLGYAFVGRHVHLELGGDDFYIDLLFYHLKLRCYVVVEIETGAFEPGHVSKLNMCQNVVNDVLNHPDDKPCIGMLLVKSHNKTIIEYALKGYRNPIGVSNWEQISNDLKSSLPSIEEIEREIEG